MAMIAAMASRRCTVRSVTRVYRAAAETDAHARTTPADDATVAGARAATRSPLRRRCRMTTDVISADLKTALRPDSD